MTVRHVVVRGGSWLSFARGCRAAYRNRAFLANRYHFIGFRVGAEVGGAKYLQKAHPSIGKAYRKKHSERTCPMDTMTT